MVGQIDRQYLSTGLHNTYVRGLSYALYEGRPLTTRPRWANHLLAPLLRLQSYRRGVATPTRPAFLVGLGRSGTTLLGQVMSTHPDIAWLNEPKLLWHIVHPDEDIIGSYDRSDNGRLRLDAADVDQAVSDRARRIYGSYLWVTRRKQVLDKYPELIYRVEFVRAIFPDARFIALQRRAAPSSRSIATWSNLHRDDEADWWGLRGKKWRALHREVVVADAELRQLVREDHAANDPELMALVEWLAAAEETARYLDDPAFHLVRYEDLLADPVTAVREICKHLSLRCDEGLESFASVKCHEDRGSYDLPDDLPVSLVRRVDNAEAALGLR